MHKVLIGQKEILFGKRRLIMTQTEAVRQYLESGKTLSSMEAFQMFGCTRLSDRIFRLRNRGYVISSIKCDTVNRYGHPTSFVRYRLVKKPKENE